MAAVTGSNTNIIFKKGATHGTAVEGVAGDKLVLGSEGSLDHTQDVDILNHGGIGSGLAMYTDGIKGGVRPSISISNMTMGYHNNTGALLRNFFGTTAVSAEITASQADYRHTFTYGASENRFGTLAFDGTSTEPIEYPSCYSTSLEITTGEANGFLKLSTEMIADVRDITSPVNATADLAAATVIDDEVCVHNQGDSFWLNLQSDGALDSGDLVNITDYTLSLSDPKELVAEFKGTNTYGAPRRTGLLEGTLTVTFKSLAALTYFTAQDAETAYKCSFAIEGTQIGTGENKSITIYVPRMKVLATPSHSLAEVGENPLSVTFQIFKASANPTGMTSTYPYIEIVNGKSAAY
jgi:hypothetical protein